MTAKAQFDLSQRGSPGWLSSIPIVGNLVVVSKPCLPGMVGSGCRLADAGRPPGLPPGSETGGQQAGEHELARRALSASGLLLAGRPRPKESAAEAIVSREVAGLTARRQYDHRVASLLESVGVTLLAAFLTACWHVLSSNEKPGAQELAIGPDLLIATMVLESGFLPASQGLELEFRWAGLVLLSIILTAMAALTKLHGYEKSSDLYRRDESGSSRRYIAIDRMTSTAAWVTSIFGSAMLCVFWWLNINIGLVVAAWKGALH
jgi:hypothetical protein